MDGATVGGVPQPRRSRRTPFGWPRRYWARQSLRARLTLLATALFALAVATGAVLLVVLQRVALLRVLDGSSTNAGRTVKTQVLADPGTHAVDLPISAGVTSVQVLTRDDQVHAASTREDFVVSKLDQRQLDEARAGKHFDIVDTDPRSGAGNQLRVVGVRVDDDLTVVVYTDLSSIDYSVRVLTRAALIGAPIAVLLLGLSTYFVVALTLRSVAALRHGAADITAAALSGQRLPVPTAQDEIRRLALTLNQMLDRIETATSRQRTFVGDAAHELRSPLASLRVQLEVTQRLGPDGDDWPAFLDEVLIDVGRLDRLVADLLILARLDEQGGRDRSNHQQVPIGALVESVVAGYDHARVPVVATIEDVAVLGDQDALHRVVVNLVDNAVRYAQHEVAVMVSAGADQVELTVTDDGPGLPAEERERVFDRFYRSEYSRSRDSGGTGLGLPIVRDLVRAHRGTIVLQARPDGADGLQALVRLPLAPTE